MAYDKARNKVHCFSCEADLDIIDLIERDYNVGTSEAFEIGYRKYNIIIDDYKPKITPETHYYPNASKRNKSD